MNEHAFHSRAEFKASRALSGYGTIKQRLGEDSQLPFGSCSLSLQPVIDPVCTPSGHLYSKEIIYEYMLKKISDIEKEKKAYEEQEANFKLQKESEKLKRKQEEIAKFINTQDSATVSSSSSSKKQKTGDGEKKRGNEILDRLSKVIDTRSKAEKVSELAESSPWMPHFAPEAEAKLVKAPRRRPPSPITGADLRMKDLYPVDLEPSSESKGKYVCAVTKKEIKYQPVIFIRKSKKVMTEESFERLAKKSKRCPVTNIKFKDKDVVKLVTGSSSFAASAKEKALGEHYRPNV